MSVLRPCLSCGVLTSAKRQQAVSRSRGRNELEAFGEQAIGTAAQRCSGAPAVFPSGQVRVSEQPAPSRQDCKRRARLGIRQRHGPGPGGLGLRPRESSPRHIGRETDPKKRGCPIGRADHALPRVCLVRTYRDPAR